MRTLIRPGVSAELGRCHTGFILKLRGQIVSVTESCFQGNLHDRLVGLCEQRLHMPDPDVDQVIRKRHSQLFGKQSGEIGGRKAGFLCQRFQRQPAAIVLFDDIQGLYDLF